MRADDLPERLALRGTPLARGRVFADVAPGDLLLYEDSGGSPHSAGLNWQQGDSYRAERDLGWRPRYSLRESLTDLWEGRRAAGAA